MKSKIEELEKIEKEISHLISKSRGQEYEYQYFKELVPDHHLMVEYGSSREGFEKFKADKIRKESGFNIDFGGRTSLRAVRKDGLVTMFVTETGASKPSPTDEIGKKLEEMKDILYKEINVRDEFTMDTYIKMQTELMNDDEKAEYLVQFLIDYDEDVLFHNVVNKLKG